MGSILVLAGSYCQYMQWLGFVYGGVWRTVAGAPRFVHTPCQLLGISAVDVDAFHQVGTYWDNPLWGSEEYRRLMADGVAVGKAWAMTPDEDWRRAERLRDPVTDEQLDEARRGLVRLERFLADGE